VETWQFVCDLVKIKTKNEESMHELLVL